MRNRPTYTWMNGEITPWEASSLHVNTDCVLRGANVFEGLRGYASASGDDVLVFRLDDHIRRLVHSSMRVLHLSIPFDEGDLSSAVLELIAANEFHEDVHIRVVAYFGEGLEGSISPEEITTGAFLTVIPRPHPETIRTGVRCTISAWRRISDNAMPPRVKAGANYLNSRYAIADARLKGYDLPIFLNGSGKVAEGAAQCIFLVRNDRVLTPRITDGILESITRDTVLRIAEDLGISAEQRQIDASELFVADELFFAGTAAGIVPIVHVDGYQVGTGSMGPITERIQSTYFAVVRGESEMQSDWLTPVYAARSVGAV